MMTRFALCLCPLLLLACTSEKIVVFTDGDPIDAGSPDDPADMTPLDEGAPDPVTFTNLDLLLVVDNSASMTEEQASLLDELPVLLRTLATGEILNPNTGAVLRTFPPVNRLRVGVVSTDMGTGGFSVPTCSNTRFGDDGLLIATASRIDSRCMATYPTPQALDVMDPSDPRAVEEAVAQLAVDVSCVAQLGTEGCGFEQPLDAMLKAVTLPDSGLRFQEGTPGHRVVNGDFGSDDAVLAVLVLTDEDDCSTFEPDLFNPSSTRFTGDLNLRCFRFPEAIHPISRFRDGLVRDRAADRLVFMAITGIPVRLAPTSNSPQYDLILADGEMQEVVDPDDDTRLLPSCNVPGRGLAFPPRRIVQLAQELDGRGAHASLASICQRDYGPAILNFTQAVADALAGR